MKKIELLSADKEDTYGEFLAKHASSLFYHSLKYKHFLEALLNCEPHYFMLYENAQLTAVLPLMLKNGKWGLVANTLPYYGSHGAVISDSVASRDILISEYQAFITNSSIAAATFVSNPFDCNDYEVTHHHLDHRLSQVTFLSSNNSAEEYLWGMIDGSARRNIKKAEKEHIVVEVDNNAFEFLYQTHKENMEEIRGQPKSEVFFKLIPQYFEADKDYQIYVAYREAEPIAALLLFYFNGIVEYFTPVVKREFRELQALPVILWKAMQAAKQQGYRAWNWGGTWLTQEGVHRFKKKWGATEKTYPYYISINRPEILRSTPEELKKEYPGFYVANYAMLSNAYA